MNGEAAVLCGGIVLPCVLVLDWRARLGGRGFSSLSSDSLRGRTPRFVDAPWGRKGCCRVEEEDALGGTREADGREVDACRCEWARFAGMKRTEAGSFPFPLDFLPASLKAVKGEEE